MIKTSEALAEDMISLLQGKSLVTMQLYDSNEKKVISSALSWLYAMDAHTIRFAIDSKSYLLSLIEQDPSITLNVIGLESVYSISGEAQIIVKQMEGLTLKLAFVEIQVQEVRDINFYGCKITNPPQFIKTYKQELIDQLDKEVALAVKMS